MALCKFCKKDMADPATVTCVRVTIDQVDAKGNDYEPVRFSSDLGSDRCHDCNVRVGQYHHPGCDVERCPICHGQLISCGCDFKNDEEEEEEDD